MIVLGKPTTIEKDRQIYMPSPEFSDMNPLISVTLHKLESSVFLPSLKESYFCASELKHAIVGLTVPISSGAKRQDGRASITFS
jgi:hypothetical protein